MNFVTSISLVVLGAMFLALLGWGSIRAAWRNCKGRRGVFAALAILAAVCSIVAQKPSPDTPTITVDALLRDVGCYATNNVFHAAVTNAPSYAGVDFSDCDLMVYARERASTNAASWFELTPRKKFSQQPADYAIENATNFNYMVYLNYVPPSPVHTNGVFELYGFVIGNEAQGEPDQLAAGFINSRAFLAPPTAGDYIQDGLVAMWDGIENAGWGIHDPNATTWIDLIGGLIASSIDPSQVGADFMLSDGIHRCYLPSLPSMEKFTIEMVVSDIKRKVSWFSVWAASNDNNSIGWPNTSSTTINWKYFSNRPGVSFDGGTLTALADGTTSGRLIVNGQSSSSSVSGSHLSWGTSSLQWSNPWGNNRGTLRNHCIRIYSRVLTPEEIQYNNNIDKRRFNLP